MSGSPYDSIYNNNSASRGSPAGGFKPYNLIQPELSRGYSGSMNEVEQPEKLLEQTLTNRIAGLDAAENKPIESDFSAEAVAGRILDFVESSIKRRAGSDIEAQSLLQQAREGIQQGFADARGILNARPDTPEDVNTQVDNTEKLIFQGLDRLDNLYLSVPQSLNTQLISEKGAFSSQVKQSNEALLNIVTRDGDRVSVSYSALFQTDTNQRYAIDQQGASTAYNVSTESSINFQFNVQGNIDEGEKQAINDLLKETGKLAEQFFQGDVQAAFNAAQSLGFDSTELKSFALDFQQTTQIKVAQTYQRTEQFASSNVNQRAGAGPGSAVAVLSQLDDLVALAEDNLNVSDAEKTFKSLLIDMIDLLSDDFDITNKNYIKGLIKNK